MGHKKKKSKVSTKNIKSNIEDHSEDNKEESSLKRICNNDESEDEQPKPKKRKKKIQSEPPNASNKKTKSIRQMKKEKFAERQAQQAAASKDQLKSQCLSYLSQWKHDKSNWKFMKVKQMWLYKNKFSTNLISSDTWPTLLEYFESAMGNIHKMLLEDAHKIIKEMDEWKESQNKEDNIDKQETDNSIKKPDDIIYKRARDLIQCLQE